MTFDSICRIFARRYGWTVDVVAGMTPYQMLMYAPDLGDVPSMNPVAAMAAMAGASSGDGTHRDARFPGKKMRTFGSMTEAQQYVRR